MVQMVNPSSGIGVRITKKDDRRSGAAMTASGTALGSTGLVAGGVPGVREPNGLEVFNVRGSTKKQRQAIKNKQSFPHADPRGNLSPVNPANLRHNLKRVAPLPRAGILGFRANVHQGFITENQNKTGGDAYVRGVRSGKLDAEHKIVRGMRIGRRASYGLTGAGAALAYAGHRKSKMQKRQGDFERDSATALAGGATVAGIGHVVPAGLHRYERKYATSAKHHVLAAQRLHPAMGGLETLPAKAGAFGNIVKPAKQTMYPAIKDSEHRKMKTSEKIRGTSVKEQVGHHRGVAAQERHFAEVFNSTGKAIRRARNPGLAAAAAGGAGLLGSSSNRKMQAMGKSAQWGWQERKVSPVRATELGVGIASLSWGGSRLKMVGNLVARGAKQGGPLARGPKALEGVRNVTGRGSRMVGDRVPGFGTAASVVPSKLRPAAAAAAGAVLVNDAVPVRRSTFTPTRRF